MTKKEILNIINRMINQGKKYKWSKRIKDIDYFKKQNINNITGYGIYEYEYDTEPKNRFCLYIKLGNSNKNNNTNKSLTVLLMNPSNTFPKDIAKQKKCKPGFDQTIRNLITFANEKEYNQIVVLNTFPYIESDSKKANKHYKDNKNEKPNKLNKKFVEKIINNSKEVLVAYGSNIDEDLHNEYLELLKNIKKEKKDIKLYTYASELTKGRSPRPRHFSQQSYNNIKNPALYELKIVEKYQYQIQAP